MALDRGDWQALAALKDEVDRAVALLLPGGGGPEDNCREHDPGTDCDRHSWPGSSTRRDDASGEHGRDRDRLACGGTDRFSSANQRMVWTQRDRPPRVPRGCRAGVPAAARVSSNAPRLERASVSGLAWRAHGATSYADQTSRLAAANHTPLGAACRGLGRCLAAPRGPDRYTPNRRQRISSKGVALGLRRSLACLARDVKAALRIVFSVYRFREGLKRSATLGVRLSLVCREDWSAGSSSTAPEG